MIFTPTSFGLRFLFAVILVFASFNPEGYSYFDWIYKKFPDLTVEQAFVGLGLVIGWVIYLRATLRALGLIGMILAFTFFGLLIGVLYKWGWINLDASKMVIYLVETLFAIVLSVGMSWSHIRRRMSGQMDMDDVDEG